jgi:uncharacterized protein YcbK (DUF882 family)
VAAHDASRDRYREWLASQNLPFGFDAELAALADRVAKGITNATPPVDRWHRILPTVRVLEMVRQQFGPTTINSAYRSTTYNLAIGGVGDSRHAQNDAIDFSCRNGSPGQWGQFVRELRDAKVFVGGVGQYETFVHIDTRGTIATWTG